MASFSFKSAGIKFDDRKVQNNEITLKKTAIGIKTPLMFSSEATTGLFELHYDALEQVKDNLRNLVKTNRGERLGRENYGCNLNSILFDYARIGEFENQLSKEINQQVELFLPFVQVKSITFLDYFSKNTSNVSSKSVNSIGIYPVLISITYDVPKIGASNQILQIVLNVGG